jgi:hypothetical protein
VVHLAEPPGHVAEGGYDAELPEPGGEGGDSRTDHGPVVPAAQPQPARPRYRTLPGSVLNAACLVHYMFPAGSLDMFPAGSLATQRDKATTMRRAA